MRTDEVCRPQVTTAQVPAQQRQAGACRRLRIGQRASRADAHGFQIGLGVAIVSSAMALWSVLHQQFWGVVVATLVGGYYSANAAL